MCGNESRAVGVGAEKDWLSRTLYTSEQIINW